jgi:hypothetical protein
VLLSSDVTGSQITEKDDPILRHLYKIETKKEDETTLTLVFYFSENEWFTNPILTKTFELEGDTIKKSFGD